MPLALLTAGLVNEDAAHRLGGGGEEVIATLKLLIADQPQVGFMHEGGCVERLAWLFVGELGGGKLAQLVVNQRQQFRGGGGITVSGRICQTSGRAAKRRMTASFAVTARPLKIQSGTTRRTLPSACSRASSARTGPCRWLATSRRASRTR